MTGGQFPGTAGCSVVQHVAPGRRGPVRAQKPEPGQARVTVERDDQPPAGERPANVPAAPHTYTTPQLEAVIRRALELQAGQSAGGTDGVPEADVVRIGQELGLEPAAVRRAMAEVRGRPPEERGALDSFVGTATVRASRVLQRPASAIAPQLDRYLRDAEYMVAQRRYAGRTRYVQDPSIAAGIARLSRSFSRSTQPLKLKEVEVAVSPLDPGSCLVELSVNLATTRGGLIAGVFGSSSVLATGWAATVWATPIADPLMLVGLPVLAGAWAGMRAIYRTVSRSNEEKLELLLDRLEHDEL